VAYRELPVSSVTRPTPHIFQRRLADKVHTVEVRPLHFTLITCYSSPLSLNIILFLSVVNPELFVPDLDPAFQKVGSGSSPFCSYSLN
jgi:hypothetical protein